MRAKTRAVAVSAGVALVVVPLSGAAAVAIAGDSPVTPDVEAVASQGAEYVDQVEQIGAPVAADSEASTLRWKRPRLDVKPNPKPVVVVRRTYSSARTVANSANVSQAIAGSRIIAEAAKYVGTPYVVGRLIALAGSTARAL